MTARRSRPPAPSRRRATRASWIRPATLAVVAGALALGLAGCTTASPEPPTPPPAPLRVVSLGDSYSTGTGSATPLPGDPGVCGRTVAASVRVAAASVGAELVDAACDGATTADLLAPRERGGQTLPAQIDEIGRAHV